MKHDKRRRIAIAQVLGVAVTALAVFGIWITARATWVIAHGGDTSFQGTFKYPSWSAVHFVPALVFAMILPFQLWPGLRRLYPQLHRQAGRVASVAGVLFSLTGLILPFVMPARPFGERAFMTTVSCLFPILLACGVRAARRKDFVAHRQWMLRVTALSMGPLSQRVIFPFFAAAGINSLPQFWDLFMSAAWFSLAVNRRVVDPSNRNRGSSSVASASRHCRCTACQLRDFMAQCEVCGNDYDKSFEVLVQGQTHVFDSFECAIHQLAPTCAHCGCRIVGHGIEAGPQMFCCANCARHSGVRQTVDRV